MLFAGETFAQTATDSSTMNKSSAKPSPTKILEKESRTFIDKLASKVAELNLVEKRGLIGTVTNTSDLQLIINDLNKEPFIIDVDELTKFASSSAEEDSSFGISDLSKGDIVGILGLYNKQTRRTLARFIEILILPKVITGAIVGVDDENFAIDVVANDNTTYTVDVETSTKSSSYTKKGDLVKSGFSKFAPGQHILVRGFPAKNNPKKITATRIVTFPEIPKNPQIKDVAIPTEETAPTVTPKK